MNQLNKIYMAASVAVVQGHADQGQKLKSGFLSLHNGSKRQLFSARDASDIRPLAGAVGSDGTGLLGSRVGDERVNQNDESLRRVMYLNCWSQG